MLTAAVSCGLEEGGLQGISVDGDSGATTDATTDDALARSDGDTEEDATPGDGGALDGGGPVHVVLANTATNVYAFDVDTHVLADLGTFAACGLDGGYDWEDIAIDSNRVLHVVTWKSSGVFSFYAYRADGGCVDVHGGPGTNPAASSMWVGFEPGTPDTLLSLVTNGQQLYTYDPNASYIATFNALPSGGAKADVACSGSTCYTALAHNHCPTDPGGAHDCLYSFEADGGAGKQLGDFGVGNVVGLAYDRGYVYAFCDDGKIVQMSTSTGTAGSVVPDVHFRDGGALPSGWRGAASVANAP